MVATDDDGDALTYTIGVSTDASLFDIRREFGQLFSPEDGSLTAQLDYEGAKAFYEIEVEVKDRKTDNGSPDDAVDDTITVIIIVTDEDEAPMFADENDSTPDVVDATRMVREDRMANWPIGTPVTAMDSEGATLMYSLSDVPGKTDAASFNFDRRTGQLKIKDPLNFETKEFYEVMVTASDGTHESEPITVTITVTEVNEPPMFTEGDTATRSIAENTTRGPFGAPLIAVDPEDDTLTYSLIAMPGDPNLLFSINGGQLSNDVGLDHETKSSYTVIARVTDNIPSGVIDDEIMVTITVTKVNEPPTFPNAPTTADASKLYVYEGDAGQMVFDPDGELKATDLDAGDTLGYKLSGTGAGSFSINSNTGKLTSTATLSDTDSKYAVTVTATDRGGLSAQQNVEIEVKAVTESDNKKPAFLETETGEREVAEGPEVAEGTEGRPVGSRVETDAVTNDRDIHLHP